MAQVSTNEFKGGIKVEVDGEPYEIISNEFVKPGKGQPFNRVKLKNLLSSRVIERTYKSGDKLEIADIEEHKMRMVYKEQGGVVFMDEETYEQITIPFSVIDDKEQWLMEEILYSVIFYKGSPIEIVPPTFMEMKVVDTAPGVRGDTASGRVLKSAITESGSKIQVPIFVEEGDKVKIDTRTGEYVSRV